MLSLTQRLRIHFGPVKRRVHRSIRPGNFKESYINAALISRPNSTYLEIGVRDGDSFRTIRASRKIAVDPVRSMKMQKLQPGEEFFEQYSDVFFEGAGEVLAHGSVDVALVDGLHEFRQALRDVLNLEPYMASNGVIVVDDCNPPTREQADELQCPGNWNGDVWKVIAFLRAERPDLRCVTLDGDQGIGLISGFSAKPVTVSSDAVEAHKALDFTVLEDNRREVIGLTEATIANARTVSSRF